MRHIPLEILHPGDGRTRYKYAYHLYCICGLHLSGICVRSCDHSILQLSLTLDFFYIPACAEMRATVAARFDPKLRDPKILKILGTVPHIAQIEGVPYMYVFVPVHIC